MERPRASQFYLAICQSGMNTQSMLGVFRGGVGRRLRQLRYVARTALGLILQPLAVTVRLLDYRLLRIPCVDRVGHLALDINSYLKENALRERSIRPVYLLGDPGFSRSGIPANPALVRYWRRYIRVVSLGPLWQILAAVRDLAGPADDLSDYAFNITISARAYEIQGKWTGRPPLLSLDEADREQGARALKQMGLPHDAWFVCLHAREGGYSSGDEHYHSYRNSEIDAYGQAAAMIVARGGWCIRTGNSTMRPVQQIPGVIDYARSVWKSDWMDLYLCANCRFFLGDSSGLFNVAGIFGRMSVLANMAPMISAYSPFPGDLTIPKRMVRNGRPMMFAECFSPEIGRLRLAGEFAAAGVSFIANSGDEIAALVIEALERVDQTATYTEEDELLQERMRGLVQAGQYCWPASSRIGRDYLRSHSRELLESSMPPPGNFKVRPS